jgi:hypothetical protein
LSSPSFALEHEGNHQANGRNGEGSLQGEAIGIGVEGDRFLELGHQEHPQQGNGNAKEPVDATACSVSAES